MKVSPLLWNRFSAACVGIALSFSCVSPALAEELRVIARSVDIQGANPQNLAPLSLHVGDGTGFYPQINHNGDVLFGAHVWNGDPADYGLIQMYRYREEEGTQYLLGDLDPLETPDGQNVSTLLGASLNLSYKPTITADGEALFMSRLDGPGITTANNLGIVRAEHGSASALIAQNQTPLSGLSVTSISAAIEPANRAGEQYLAVRLDAAGNETAVLHRSALGTQTVLRTGDEVPGIEGAVVATIPSPLRTLSTVNPDGDAAFGVTLAGKGLNQFNNGAVLAYRDGALEVVARDGMLVDGAAPGCEIYGSSYARPHVNQSGKVAFHAGVNCGPITVFTDRLGSLERVAYPDKLFDGPTGRFRIGLLNEVTTTFGALGDTNGYLKAFLSDSGDVFVLTGIMHEDRTLRSGWGIVRIRPDGSAQVIVESAGQHSGLGFDLIGSPFPEQISFARDGSMLMRVQESVSDRVLISWSPARGLIAIRNGDTIGDLRVEVGGSNTINGLALSAGRLFADVRVRPIGDNSGSSHPAILAVDDAGNRSLPLVRGMSTLRDAASNDYTLVNFASPFWYTHKRHVANDSGAMVTIATIQREGQEPEEAIILLAPDSPALVVADFNQDGVVNPADIFAFLAAYFAGDSRADMNGSGALEVSDIFAFLNEYFAA